MRGLIDARFALDTIEVAGGPRALVSVVPFEDEDFRWAASDGPRWRFGQTNYRVYEPHAPLVLAGFADTATALDVLTHPLEGFYRTRGGRLASYSVWHERLTPTPGRVRHAHIGLFDRLGLVPFAEQQWPHSVLIQERTEFQVHLPPRRC